MGFLFPGRPKPQTLLRYWSLEHKAPFRHMCFWSSNGGCSSRLLGNCLSPPSNKASKTTGVSSRATIPFRITDSARNHSTGNSGLVPTFENDLVNRPGFSPARLRVARERYLGYRRCHSTRTDSEGIVAHFGVPGSFPPRPVQMARPTCNHS